jgi:hypothetical protein
MSYSLMLDIPLELLWDICTYLDIGGILAFFSVNIGTREFLEVPLQTRICRVKRANMRDMPSFCVNIDAIGYPRKPVIIGPIQRGPIVRRIQGPYFCINQGTQYLTHLCTHLINLCHNFDRLRVLVLLDATPLKDALHFPSLECYIVTLGPRVNKCYVPSPSDVKVIVVASEYGKVMIQEADETDEYPIVRNYGQFICNTPLDGYGLPVLPFRERGPMYELVWDI